MKAIEVSNLYKSYSTGTDALKGFNLTIERGDFFAILGPNGAGKSTLIGIITSLVTKTKGRVTVMNYDLDRHPKEVKKCLGLVPQEFNCNFFEKIENTLIQQAGYYGVNYSIAKKRAEKYLKLLDLYSYRHEIARTLSGGMKRRLLIARAMVHEPAILILDEPTAGVDTTLRKTIWNFLEEINNKGTTIILTTHYLEEVEKLCRNVAIINHGELVIHTSIKDLIDMLPGQSYVVYLQNGFSPKNQNLSDSPFTITKIKEQSIELIIKKGTNINELIAYFDAKEINIKSISHKTNPVESIFTHLTAGG